MSMPAGENHGVVDNRAERISDLRAFLGMLESAPSLPVPLTFTAAAYMPRTPDNEVTSVQQVFAAAEQLGTDVHYNRREGRVETTWKRGSVSYTVYTRLLRPEPDKTWDVVTVTSPAQIPTATATIVRPDLPQSGEAVDEQMTGTGDAEAHSRPGGAS